MLKRRLCFYCPHSLNFFPFPVGLTHLPLLPHICVSEWGQHWSYSTTSHYLNQCWVIVNWTLRNKLQWNFNKNSKLFIHEKASENIVCEMAAILSRGRRVNRQLHSPGVATLGISLGYAGLVLNIVIGDHLGLLFMHSFCNMSISHTGHRFLIDSFQEPRNYSCHYVLSSRRILHGYLWLHMSQSLARICLLCLRCPCQLHFIQDHCHIYLSILCAYSITITIIESITTADDIKTLLMDGDTDSLNCLLIHCN